MRTGWDLFPRPLCLWLEGSLAGGCGIAADALAEAAARGVEAHVLAPLENEGKRPLGEYLNSTELPGSSSSPDPFRGAG